MARCPDCIHQYCCKYDRFLGVNEVENKCMYFKPTADIVEVVRCKECKYFAHGTFIGWCFMSEIESMHVRYPDDFCSRGEKKERNKNKMNKFSKALDRIKKNVEPQDNWSEEDWEHFKTVCEALEMASEKEERIEKE